ncbi:MAG: ABC transporter ATP-binding protein [Sphingobacteriales bacterium]|nr:MAG: ABC transporter ATP-binding protein [Sphingobacteriales bacterium]
MKGIIIFLMLIVNAITISGPVIIQQAVDNYIKPGDFQGLMYIMSLYFVCIVIGFFANYKELVILETAGQSIVSEIKKYVFKHLLTLNMSFFDKNTTGTLVSRVENDSNAMLVLFTTILTKFIGSTIMLIGMLCIMFFKYNSKLALILLAFVPVMLISAAVFLRPGQRRKSFCWIG